MVQNSLKHSKMIKVRTYFPKYFNRNSLDMKLITSFSLLQKIKCQRKEPCRLFSVRKNYERPLADEVNTSSLCQCPHKTKCPKHHLDVGVIPGKIYSDDSVRTYSAYCM